MTRVGRVVAAAVTAVSLLAGPAAAQSVGTIADALLDDGYYLEGGSAGEDSAIRSAVTATGASYLVVLESEVGDPSLFADQLLDELGAGTVVVLTPDLIGAASTSYTDAEIDAAFDASIDAFDDDLGEGLRAFDEELGAVAATGGSEPVSSSSGGGGSILLVILVLVVGGIGFMIWRNKRKTEEAGEARIDEAKAEIETQTGQVANDIIDLADRVTVSENEQAEALFRTANATFSRVQESLPKAETLTQLEELSDQLDEARWQLESVQAVLDGREPPPKPEEKPAACFFDPTHGAGTEEAVIRTPAGDKTVGVCKADAQKIRSGDKPSIREIDVGGRRVPAPRAPKSYGGRGFDWMDVFSVIVGGTNVGYDLRRQRRSPRRARRTSGGLGGPIFPTSTGRRSSGSRTRSSSGRTRARTSGRATRSRSRGRSSRRRR